MAEHITTIPRLRTGVPGLDELLGGGLLEGRTMLLKGAPGSGKTTLGLQTLVAGATDYNEPGILLTFEQMPEQIYADAAGFGWDLKKLSEENLLKVIFIKPEDVLEQPGRQENRLLVNIADWLDDVGAKRIMIDSISHLRPLFAGEQARPQLMRFLIQLKSMGLTPIMTAELNTGDGLAGLDAYLVDAVIHLAHPSSGVGQPSRRLMEIIKTRGQHHVGGAHPFEIGPHGLSVYPHTERPVEAKIIPFPAMPPISTGIHGLDPLLGGGYQPGSTVLVAGLSGTFKTTLAVQYLMSGGNGAEPASPGLWISFQETADQLRDLFGRHGINLAEARASGKISVMEIVPGSEPIEKTLLTAERFILERGIGRVVIDSINELAGGQASEGDRQEGAHWFLRRLRALGVTTMITQRLTRVTGRNPLSEINWAELADTIVYLGLVEIESRLEKVISVLKHRGGPTEGDLRSIGSMAGALRVSDRFVGLSGVLDGTPLGRPKARIEEIFQPLYFIRDFLNLARDPSLEMGKRAGILENLSAEAEQLIHLLGRYFDQPLPHKDEPHNGQGSEANPS